MGSINETRMCPLCAEAIKLEAIVCKHCGQRIDQYPTSWTPKHVRAQKGEGNSVHFVVYGNRRCTRRFSCNCGSSWVTSPTFPGLTCAADYFRYGFVWRRRPRASLTRCRRAASASSARSFSLIPSLPDYTATRADLIETANDLFGNGGERAHPHRHQPHLSAARRAAGACRPGSAQDDGIDCFDSMTTPPSAQSRPAPIAPPVSRHRSACRG
jgi:hypothetical protein